LERLVKFEVCGQEFALNTDAPEDEVGEILDLVKSQIESQTGTGKVLPARVAILVSLNMAGKYVRLKKELAEDKRLTDHKINAIINNIEEQM
jgi:cell division protein ZapA